MTEFQRQESIKDLLESAKQRAMLVATALRGGPMRECVDEDTFDGAATVAREAAEKIQQALDLIQSKHGAR
jgi:hypothetical protein